MGVGNQALGSDLSAKSRRDARQPGHLPTGRDRCGPAESGRLAREATCQSIRAAGRGINQDDSERLGECSLFCGLAADERAALIAHARIRKCAADEIIFLMGSPGDSILAVLSGRVRISVASPHGKEIVLAIRAAGEIFGEHAVLDGRQRNTDAHAVGECRLAILDRRDVQSFFERHAKAWPRLVATLCERLRNADQQIAEMALMGLPVRIAKTLLRMTAMEPHAPNGKPSSQVCLTQREIGDLVGATRESVNKSLSGWQRKGIVRIAESLITILDRPALEEVAQRR